MEVDRKFLITYTPHYDCPSCDGNGAGSPEEIRTETFDSIEAILEEIKKNVDNTYYLEIYEIVKMGELKHISTINTETGGHRVLSVSFSIDDEPHQLLIIPNPHKREYRWLNKTEKVLYGPK
jgi:hypothetical protein